MTVRNGMGYFLAKSFILQSGILYPNQKPTWIPSVRVRFIGYEPWSTP